MHGKYNPTIPTESTTTSSTPTTTNDSDMQQFYTVVLSIVALSILAMILIYAMRRPS
jgi:hypothetical protein